MFRMLGVVTLAGLVTGMALADVESGPKAGDKIETLKAYGVVGTIEGKEADFAADRKDRPAVYLFVSAENFSRPVARFIKVLDGQLVELDANADAVAVWLTKDVDKGKEYMPTLQKSLKLELTSLGWKDPEMHRLLGNRYDRLVVDMKAVGT